MLITNSAVKRHRGRSAVKRGLNAVAMVLTAPCAATCWLEGSLLPTASGVFAFWTNVMALMPGTPGRFLRRAFYRWTLDYCAHDVTIEFGTIFSRRNVYLESGVYVGAYALIGSARVGANTLIGSRVSLLSGGQHHQWLPTGGWSPTDPQRLASLEIGSDTWIGEGSIVMANIGPGSMVAAGAVVGAAVPPHTMVAGNPARFVRRIAAQPAEALEQSADASRT